MRRLPVSPLRRCGNYFHRVAWRLRDRRSLRAQHHGAPALLLLLLLPLLMSLMPNAERRTPNAERRTPNAERRTPNAERRTPNAERRTPNAERRTPTIRTPADREPARAARPT
ncbi:hypothetical protein QZM71_13060 [Burkholderia multivorans]|nr:hypothetical protein [Burkholderia multivorans]MDN7475784.1 hypothetical protein [Burkholderia multivorans]